MINISRAEIANSFGKPKQIIVENCTEFKMQSLPKFLHFINSQSIFVLQITVNQMQ